MPGESARESSRIVAGELPDLLHVVELPARGPGADMIGRTGAMLTGIDASLGLETTPGGWRVSGSLGRQMRRALSFLGEDLDALEEVAVTYRGPLKCQIAGPWTFAASVEGRSGERLLRDAGAIEDVSSALAAAITEHVADLRRRVPGASDVLVQVDEPGLPAVLAGTLASASGLSRFPAVDPQRAGRVLGVVLGAVESTGAVPGVHCCASAPPVTLMREAGAGFVSIDITALGAGADQEAADREIGTCLESGVALMAGAVPALGAAPSTDTLVSAPLRGLLHRLGLEDDRHLAQIAVSPACGLAGASPAQARAALAAAAAVGRVLRHDESSEGGQQGGREVFHER